MYSNRRNFSRLTGHLVRRTRR